MHSEYSSGKNILIVTYFKNGHHTPRYFADRLFEGNTTRQLFEYICDNQVDKIIFIIRHPFERFLSGLKEHFISFGNIGSINSHQEEFEKTSLFSDYMSYQSATKFIHDERVWKDWLSRFDWTNFEADVHIRKHLDCFEYFAELCAGEGIDKDIVDMDAMTYYFASYGCFLPVEHRNGMSDRIDNFIMDFIIKNESDGNVLENVARHINPEVKCYKKLKVYNNSEDHVLNKILPKESYNSHYWEILKYYEDYLEDVS